MDAITESFYRQLGTLNLTALREAFKADRAAARQRDTIDFCTDRINGIEKILTERMGPLVWAEAGKDA